MADEKPNSFIETLDAHHRYLKGLREAYEPVWSLILPIMRPERAGLDWKVQEGSRGSEIFDTYAALALQTWARGLVGNMVYPKARWLDVGVNDRRLMDSDETGKEVLDWCQEWGEELFHGFNESRTFYERCPEMAMDAGAVMGVLMPHVDEQRRLHWLSRNPAHCWIGVDFLGEVDRFHDELELPAVALADEFGKENVSELVRQYLKQDANRFTKVRIVHAIFPNPDYDPYLPKPRARDREAYVEVWYESNTRHSLAVDGREELPIVWRVQKLGDWWYGTSPGWGAVTDALANDQMTQTLLLRAHMEAQPPLLGPPNLKFHLKNVPNGYTAYTRPEDKIERLYEGSRWQPGDEERQRIRDNIDRWFSVQFFMALTMAANRGGDRPPTAFHISRLDAERYTLLGPQVSSFETDVGNPAVDIVWRWIERYGTPPEMPAVLADAIAARQARRQAPLRTAAEFTGILAQTQQRTVRGRSIMDSLMVAQMIQGMMPDAIHALKPYHLMRDAMEAGSLSQDLVRSQDEYDAMMAELNEREDLMQQVAMNKELAGAYQSMSKDAGKASPAGKVMEAA